MEYFNKLSKINVNEHTENKEGLTYLSWCWAWAEVLKEYPDATYTIERFGENKVPYLYDEKLGYMVFTKVTIEGLEKEMWLPVMDSKNKSMKDKPYTYKTKYGDKPVEAATMFDINKTIMRCLVKNLAMFGLGMYIYAGEDLPESEKEEVKETKKTKKSDFDLGEPVKVVLSDKARFQKIDTILKYGQGGVDLDKMLDYYKVEDVQKLSDDQLKDCIEKLIKKYGEK